MRHNDGQMLYTKQEAHKVRLKSLFVSKRKEITTSIEVCEYIVGKPSERLSGPHTIYHTLFVVLNSGRKSKAMKDKKALLWLLNVCSFSEYMRTSERTRENEKASEKMRNTRNI